MTHALPTLPPVLHDIHVNVETVGKVLLTVGLAAPLIGLALASDMLVALVTAHIDQGFFVDEGGFGLVLLLGGLTLAIALTGAGRFSVDAAPGCDPAPLATSQPRGRKRPARDLKLVSGAPRVRPAV